MVKKIVLTVLAIVAGVVGSTGAEAMTCAMGLLAVISLGVSAVESATRR
jgi:hypothetical protein